MKIFDNVNFTHKYPCKCFIHRNYLTDVVEENELLMDGDEVEIVEENELLMDGDEVEIVEENELLMGGDEVEIVEVKKK